MCVSWWVPHSIHINILKALSLIRTGYGVWTMKIQIYFFKKNKITVCKNSEKGVPRMTTGSLRHQYDSQNHILSVSCVWIHPIGTLKRAKVIFISKVCVVTQIWPLNNTKFIPKMIKIVFKWTKYTHTDEPLGISTRYKPLHRSITSMLSHPKHNLSGNEVPIRYRTLPSTCCRYRAGVLFEHLYWIETHYLFICHRLLI